MARTYRISVDGSEHDVKLLNRTGDSVSFVLEGQEHTVSISPASNFAVTTSEPGAAHAPVRTASQSRGGNSEPGTVRAPMPGLVVALKVKVGDTVKRTDTVAVIEAMKMENNLPAGCDGVVREIHVKAGQEVENRAVLVSITPNS